jgi:D-threonate/D-erythronate kinase
VTTDLRIAVIADDFTGAMDTGVMFANYGLHTQFHLLTDISSSDVQVVAVSTDSREKDVQSAIASIKDTASLFGNRQVFKKIDSTMRGHISAEIDALLQTTGLKKALICPTAVEAGRIVRDGILFVQGIPLHETAFANDPHYPARTSQLQELLSYSSTMHINLDSQNSGHDTVLNTIRQSSSKLITFDAVSNQDLANIAKIAIEGDYLPCGSMGLGRAWIDTLLGNDTQSITTQTIDFNTDQPLLIVSGSRHPITVRQIDALTQYIPTHIVEISEQFTGYDDLTSEIRQYQAIVLQTPSTQIEDQTDINRIYGTMRNFVQKLCDESKFAGMVIIGGETAFHVCHTIGATAIRIFGEIESGVPVGQIMGGCASSLPIVTKAGGFGTDASLCHIVDWLKLEH